MGLAPLDSQATIARLRARPLVTPARPKVLPLGLPPLDELLPDAGLPRGAVVELCSAAGLGHVTQVALAACAAAQREEHPRAVGDTASAWCAWVDTAATLYAPGVLRAGVDLDHLLVVKPPPDALARVAVRLAASHIFSVVVLDRSGVPGAKLVDRRTRWGTAVRRLALAVEGSHTTVLLLSTRRSAREQPLPVAMRVELARPEAERLSLRISKERHGRLGGPHSVSLIDRGVHEP